MLSTDKSSQLDFFAIGVAVYPYTMAEYYTMNEEMQKNAAKTPTGSNASGSSSSSSSSSSSDDTEIDLDSE